MRPFARRDNWERFCQNEVGTVWRSRDGLADDDVSPFYIYMSFEYARTPRWVQPRLFEPVLWIGEGEGWGIDIPREVTALGACHQYFSLVTWLGEVARGATRSVCKQNRIVQARTHCSRTSRKRALKAVKQWKLVHFAGFAPATTGCNVWTLPPKFRIIIPNLLGLVQ